MKVITKLYCPFCGEEMSADIHAPEDGANWRTPPGPPPGTSEKLRQMDHWICNSEEMCKCKVNGKFIMIDRDDLKEWFDVE